MNLKQFEEAKARAREIYKIGDDPYDLLRLCMCEIEIEDDKHYKELERKTEGCNLYKAINIFGIETLKDICNAKINNYEELKHFKKLKKDYCGKELNLITEAELENAKQVEVKTILDNLNIEYKRNRGKCPICNNQNNNTVFSFKDNHFNCFKCGAKGDGIELFQKLTGNDFKNTIKLLNNF